MGAIKNGMQWKIKSSSHVTQSRFQKFLIDGHESRDESFQMKNGLRSELQTMFVFGGGGDYVLFHRIVGCAHQMFDHALKVADGQNAIFKQFHECTYSEDDIRRNTMDQQLVKSSANLQKILRRLFLNHLRNGFAQVNFPIRFDDWLLIRQGAPKKQVSVKREKKEEESLRFGMACL